MSVQDAQDLTKRARMFLRDEKFKGALEILQEVCELDPECASAYNLLGIAWSRFGNGKKALAAFRKGKNLDKENPVLHCNLGVALEIWGQMEKAPPRYRAAFRLHPGWLDPMNALGLNLFKLEDYAAANRSFSKVLKFDPANAEALNNKGVVLADQGRHKEAIKKYRAALEIDGNYVYAGLNLSRALEDTENFAAALEELERLADLAPADWEVRTRLAALCHRLERYDEAMDQARAILDKNPGHIQALRIEGAIQGIQGNDEAAKNIFERITSMNPSGESGDHYDRFMIRSPDSRYWLDLVPPPGAVPPPAANKPKPVADKPRSAADRPARSGGAAITLRKAAVEAAPENGAAMEPGSPAETIILVETTTPEAMTVPEDTDTLADTAASVETAGPAETTAPAEMTITVEMPAPAEMAIPVETPAPAKPVTRGDLLGLLLCLMDLGEALPEPELGNFMRSEERAEMQRIINTLEHSHG
jgi:tetratricopeptide (TPR) repeat protein